MPASDLRDVLRNILFLAVFVAFFSLNSASAQKNGDNPASSPKYNTQSETKVKATVEELKLPPKGNGKEVAHLFAKNGADTIDIYLCPEDFLADMGVTFSKGDEIALTGSKVKQGERDLVLAREVVRGNDTLVLRDDKGNPVWSWHQKN